MGYYQGQISYQEKEWQIAVDIKKDHHNNTIAEIDFLEIGAYKRIFKTTKDAGTIRFEREQPNGRPALLFDGIVSKDTIYGRFEGIGIEGATFVLKPAVKFEFDEENVIFYNDTLKLAGTFLKPRGTGKFPAVVFTHGSAPDTRDVYYGAAMQFVKNGVAALIYDKRGVGESEGGDYNTAGISGLAWDALAGVQLLLKRKDVDTTKIGVFGHSQGGWIAPMAASLSSDVDFVITSAASAVNATEQSVYHRANVMRKDGFNETDVRRAAAIRIRLNAATELCQTDQSAAIEQLKKSGEEIRSVKNERWFASAALPDSLFIGCPEKAVMELLFKDPAEIWEKVKVPAYLVWGDKDIVVPVEKRGIIIDALTRAGNPLVTAVVVPNVDHFITMTNDSGIWDFPREPKNYFGDMAEWVKRLGQKF
jgi:pimeloyl-ACP methyl ester carboxylesterase